MKHTRAAVLVLAGVLAVGMIAGGATAATAPSESLTSEVTDGATEQVTDYNSSAVAEINVSTPTGEDANASLELTVPGRDIEVYSADDQSGDYSTQSNSSHDYHRFNVSHDELANVPIQAGGEANVTYTVTSTADDGTTAELNGTFTTDQLDYDRSVVVIDETALDGDVSNQSVETSDASPGLLSLSTVTSLGGLLGDDDENDTLNYDASADGQTINGSNTTIDVYFEDPDVSDRFATKADEGIPSGFGIASNLGFGDAPEPESGDVLFKTAAVHDGSAAPVFYESADSSIAGDNDTHAVYSESNNRIRYDLGGEYDDNDNSTSRVDVRAASVEPTAVVELADVSSLMYDDLGTIERYQVFAWGVEPLDTDVEDPGLLDVLDTTDWPVVGGD